MKKEKGKAGTLFLSLKVQWKIYIESFFSIIIKLVIFKKIIKKKWV